MTAIELLSSGSVGIVVGWLAKEVLEFLKTKAAHREELQKRFFDERLAMTLKALKLMKTSATSLRTTYTLVQADVATGGASIDPGMIAETLQSYAEQTKRMGEEASGAYALLRFFHGEKIAQKADAAADETVLPIMRVSSSIFGKLGRINEEVEGLPAEAQAETRRKAILAWTDLQTDAQEALRLAKLADDRVDEIIDELRGVYKSVFGFGYE